jgi:hypothetical protein
MASLEAEPIRKRGAESESYEARASSSGPGPDPSRPGPARDGPELAALFAVGRPPHPSCDGEKEIGSFARPLEKVTIRFTSAALT